MKQSLQIGIIGASAERGWAKDSHVPAVRKLKGLELAAVVSSSQAGADAAAKAFGAPKAYATSEDLFRDPEIDIVSVAVKVPNHRDLVMGALAAGKHIYCEWPLGKNLAESEELAKAAKAAGVRCITGLQTRANPAIRQAAKLLSSGAIGRLLSANVISTTMAFGPAVERAMIFAEDAANGATLVTIQGGHTLDLAIALLGQAEDLSALASTQFKQVTVGDSKELQQRTIPDHLLVQARLRSALPLSVEVAGGRPNGQTPFSFHIAGEKGELLLEGGAPRGFQSGELQLRLNEKVQQVDEGELDGLTESALNVAGMYAAFRDDILSGSHTVPNFDHAVRLTRLIDDVLSSSELGRRKVANDWPKQHEVNATEAGVRPSR
jgi:predicted dehydrogenase